MTYAKIITLLCILIAPYFSFAQESLLNGSVTISPEYPQPFDEITVSLESYSFSTSRSFIVWKVNGKQVISGYGESKIKITLGGPGTQAFLTVGVKTPEGQDFSKSIIVTPASVQMLWEATDSYTPPFYKGKSLPPEGGAIRLVALPSLYSGGKRFDSRSVAYDWTINDTYVKNSSGLGKDSYNTNLNYLENENIFKVIATTLDGSVVAETRETVVPQEIVPRLYLTNALTGTDYAHTLSKRIEITKEANIVLEPYFISASSLSSSDISISWFLNGIPVTAQGDNFITIVPKAKSQGFGTLDITIENTKKYLQEAKTSLSIIFNTLTP